jgi:flagellar motor switch protein FliM
MPEVLSQSQIDALLASVMGGDDVEKESLDLDDKEKNYRKYDFYSPKKFTKDKLNILRNAYENYCRIVSSRINSLLRVTSEVSLVTVEEERYYEFSNALSDNDALTLINVSMPGAEVGEHIFMHITTPLILSMIDRMLGGSGEDAVNVPSSYVYTDIDLRLYENIARYIVGVMKDGWSNYIDMDFKISKLETPHGLLQEIGMDEIVVIVVIEAVINKVAGKITICIPSTLLTNMFSIVESKSASHGRQAGGEDKTSQEIFSFIEDSSLEVTAKVGDATVLLKDIYDLKEGDIINMNKPKNSDVDVYVEDNPWFKGKLGVQNKNIAVRISDVIKN